jgi:hypothetical protein
MRVQGSEDPRIQVAQATESTRNQRPETKNYKASKIIDNKKIVE